MDAVREKLIELEKQYNEISDQLISDEVISNPRKITKLSKEQAQLSGSVEAWHELQELDSRIMQAEEMLTEEDPEMKEMAQLELDECVPEREALLEKIQKMLIPRDPEDGNDVIMEIRGGAGGDEGNIFAGDLYRMYTRYAQSKGFQITVLDYQDGDITGLKGITFEVTGDNAYGYFQSEKGVHRLVRISPFNAAGKRQTSFVSCDVMPDIEEDLSVEIADEDIRIDTYRASGAGGQHINKTDSAIRITHIPTGVVVQCQNERSQHKNKDKAMQMLKAKLYLLKKQEQEEKVSGIRGEVQDINFGSQIRSYILHPYNLVKDHRTGEETGNVSAVLDGELDPFINAYLKQRSNNG